MDINSAAATPTVNRAIYNANLQSSVVGKGTGKVRKYLNLGLALQNHYFPYTVKHHHSYMYPYVIAKSTCFYAFYNRWDSAREDFRIFAYNTLSISQTKNVSLLRLKGDCVGGSQTSDKRRVEMGGGT